MPYSYPNDIPQFAKNKKAPLQRRVVELFNTTYERTKDEEASRRAALAFMSNYEKKYGDATRKGAASSGDQTKKNISKSSEEIDNVSDKVAEILKSKYNPKE